MSTAASVNAQLEEAALASSRQSLRAVPDRTFAALLRRQRLTDDLTQAELGERFGVRQQTVGAWERGERPRAKLLATLARYVGLDSEHELIELLEADIAAVQPESSSDASGAWQDMSDAEAMKLVTRTYLEGLRRQTLTSEDRPIFHELITYYRDRDAVRATLSDPSDDD